MSSPASLMNTFSDVDPLKQSFLICVLIIVACPTIWNILARLEYKTHIITRCFGSKYLGCYALAAWIFLFSLYRDYRFKLAVEDQSIEPSWDTTPVKVIAAVLYMFGLLLVLSSMWALGITGTYLGDYFGILMDEKVTCFPFNTIDDPMYTGSSLTFFAHGLWTARPAGVVLALVVFVVYRVAIVFEGSFTSHIYAERDRLRSSSSAPDASRDKAHAVVGGAHRRSAAKPTKRGG
mmetsp:Transcript_20042/g.34471  ORF Transcript_20042/g.34471 Transcript_20042/m.34471 type:complete len:235 (-) Transcript_20042:134-838(-)|eukprot:CAMPEP_0196658332 /NCGR_PEP_ID=MMETSP1086-20130531/29126_1 /TAXON_ID=77921 /ORGANISM="Cyanoptyche  gloeocystis , Strain SAG4.97" /LENGTH=234 /DNA_ID=CAMNT_0041991859 /DNA_START=18 /DNA_END=722 /DNA_ORIENTATION=+